MLWLVLLWIQSWQTFDIFPIEKPSSILKSADEICSAVNTSLSTVSLPLPLSLSLSLSHSPSLTLPLSLSLSLYPCLCLCPCLSLSLSLSLCSCSCSYLCLSALVGDNESVCVCVCVFAWRVCRCVRVCRQKRLCACACVCCVRVRLYAHTCAWACPGPYVIVKVSLQRVDGICMCMCAHELMYSYMSKEESWFPWTFPCRDAILVPQETFRLLRMCLCVHANSDSMFVCMLTDNEAELTSMRKENDAWKEQVRLCKPACKPVLVKMSAVLLSWFRSKTMCALVVFEGAKKRSVRIYVCVCMYVCVCIYIYIYIYIYICICIYIHIYMHTWIHIGTPG
jgi:hypothetical protein